MLSPTGLHVRAQPDKSAKVLGTAAQGAQLTVLGHTDAGGGWFQVKGATVTGWISADPSLSAAGQFLEYSSAQFSALYPSGWTSSPSPPANVVFRSGRGPEDIVVVAASNEVKLPKGRDGYGRSGATQIVVCGVTSELVTYQRSASASSTVTGVSSPASLQYLAQVRLTLDANHALGIYGDVADLGPQLQTFRDFVASVTFPFPQCAG